jgi:hypothetical protein
MQQKVRKWVEWTELIRSIASDPDGEDFLSEMFSSNGHSPRRGSIAARKRRSQKVEKRINAIWQACGIFQQPFGLRDLVEALQKQSFQFKRGDPNIEIGWALRELLADKKLAVTRERHGTLGRLYQRVSL